MLAVVGRLQEVAGTIEDRQHAGAGRRQADHRPVLQAVEDRPARSLDPAINPLVGPNKNHDASAPWTGLRNGS